MSVEEAADELQLTESHVRWLLGKGRLTGKKIGGKVWIVDRTSVNQYADARARKDIHPGRKAAEKPPPRPRGRPPGSKNKPKDTAND